MNWKYYESYTSDRWHFEEKYVALYNNWRFEICRTAYSKDKFSVSIMHRKLDILYNSAWRENSKYFNTAYEAKKFCETFDYKLHYCIGNGSVLKLILRRRRI